jgi:hypothetical protein
VFSPDGRYLALRTNADGLRLEVIDIARTVAKPGTSVSVLSAPLTPQPHVVEGGPEFGAVAAFADDSAALLIRADGAKLNVGSGADGLRVMPIAPAGQGTIAEASAGPGPTYVPFLGADRAQFWPVLSDPGGDGTAALRQMHVPATVHGRELTPRVRPASVRRTRDGSALIATMAEGALCRIAADGDATEIISIAAASAAVGKPIERVELLDEAADGSLLAVAWRPLPAAAERTLGTFVSDGDEAPQHGVNPGSAEPRPDLPRYLLSLRSGKLSSLRGFSLARWIDRLLLMPTPTHDAVLALLLANDGYPSHNTPHVWLGRVGADATFGEHDLGDPFTSAEGGGADPAAPWSLPTTGMPLAVSADGTRALVLIARAVARGYAFSFWVADTHAQTFSRIGEEIVPKTSLIANQFREEESVAFAPQTGWVAINLCAIGNPPIPQGTLLLHVPRW